MRNGREAFDKSVLAKYTASGLRLFPRRRFVVNVPGFCGHLSFEANCRPPTRPTHSMFHVRNAARPSGSSVSPCRIVVTRGSLLEWIVA